MKHVYLWTALAIAGLVAAIVLWRMGPPHYPKVVAAFPGNITMTFIEQPWSDAKKCATENAKVTAKIMEKCPACRIASSCPTALDATETRAFHGHASNLPMLYTEAESVLIDAPGTQAMSICTAMAEQIARQKKQRARCIAPANTH